MDPLTQGVFGGLWAQAGSRGKKLKAAGAAGIVAGMAPDLDVLIRSSSDDLLALDYHRHFTHAIPFAPIGALVVALALWPLMRRHLGFAQLYLFCFLGYLSHGILDAFTSYGTYLGWPFTDERFAFNWISVIDPLFTVPLLILLILVFRREQLRFHRIAVAWAVLYLGFGGVQHYRAEQAVAQWAAQEAIAVERLVAKPAFANLLLWRGLVDDGQRFHTIAIRLSPFGERVIYPGDTVEALSPQEVAPSNSRLARDIKRFDKFSDGWVFRYALHDNSEFWFVGDFRYAIDPASQRPLWGISFHPDATTKGVAFLRLREVDKSEREHFLEKLLGL